MITVFIEATNGEQNWGKFMLARFDLEEWVRPSMFGGQLLPQIGWCTKHLLVMDLQTGEGGLFMLGGNAHADLEKHEIWVCPLFEPFLEWLYKQDFVDIRSLPRQIDLPDAEFMLFGHRRTGDRMERGILTKLVETVIATGGFIRQKDGTLSLKGDDEWLDLADVAKQAGNLLQIDIPIEEEASDAV